MRRLKNDSEEFQDTTIRKIFFDPIDIQYVLRNVNYVDASFLLFIHVNQLRFTSIF